MTVLRVKTTFQMDEHEIVLIGERKFVDLTLCFDQAFDVQNEEKTIWDKAAVGAQDGFDVLALVSNQPVEVELVSRNGLVERSVMNFTLGKNMPLLISTDSARFDYAGDSFLGQVGEIDLIRLKENDDVHALARLRLWK